MVKVEDAVIARWETQGSRFEVLVDPEAVQELKDGKTVDLSDKLALDQVFKDAKKGDKISEEHLEKTFHTRNLAEIARQIVLKGEVQVTTEQRHKLQEAKRRQIVATIARNAMNPQTGAPHPPSRIEAAMVEAKVHVDPFRPVDAQVQEVLAKLRPLLPIRLDVVKVRVRVPGQHYPRVIGELRGLGRLLEESWGSDGAWSGILEIPAGVQTELYEKLNARTKGAAETALVK
jgi:ribosome maturation protein SDO1